MVVLITSLLYDGPDQEKDLFDNHPKEMVPIGREVTIMRRILKVLSLHSGKNIKFITPRKIRCYKVHLFLLLLRTKVDDKSNETVLHADGHLLKFNGRYYYDSTVDECRSYFVKNYLTFYDAVDQIRELFFQRTLPDEIFMISAVAVILKRFVNLADQLGNVSLYDFEEEVGYLSDLLHSFVLAEGRADVCLKEYCEHCQIHWPACDDYYVSPIGEFETSENDPLEHACRILSHTPYGYYADLVGKNKAAEEVHADVEMVYKLLRASTRGDRDAAIDFIRANMPIWKKGHGRILRKYNALEENDDANRAHKFIKTRAVANSALLKLADVFVQNVTARRSGSPTPPPPPRPLNLVTTYMDGRKVAWSKPIFAMLEEEALRRPAFEEPVQNGDAGLPDNWKEYLHGKIKLGEPILQRWNEVENLEFAPALEWFFNNILRKIGDRPVNR